jgi:hypothetical protein
MSGASGLRPHTHTAAGDGGSLATTVAFANPMTTIDDIVVGGASGVATRLAKGTDSQVLTVDPSTHHLVWATPSSGFADPMTTRGDIIIRNSGNTTARLGRGGASTVLTSDGTDVSWQAPSGGTVDASGQTTLDNLQALSDYVVGYDTSGAVTRGFPVGRIRMGRQHTVIADDCFFVATGTVHEGGVAQQVTGTGAATSIGTAVAGRVGIIQIASGTSTTGRCSLASGQVTVLGGGRVRFGTSLQLSDLSNGTNTFTWRLGLIDNGGSAPSDAVMFRYTDSVNSGKWEGVCIASSVESTVDTGITADTSWHTFEFEVNAAATSVQFYIDGAATGSPVTTHIPTTNVLCHVPAFVRRSAGTGLLTGQGLIDAYWYIYEFTTAR